MGIYDRPWYRNEPRHRVSLPRRHSAVVLLVAVNVVAFLASALLRKFSGWDPVEQGLGLVPDDVIRRFMVWQIVTSMFLHNGPVELFISMLMLFIFGSGTEQRIGRGPFLRLYFGAGILAALCYIVFGLFRAPFSPAVGSFPACLGLIVYFTLVNPDYPVNLFFVIRMRMKWATIIILAFDLYWFVFTPARRAGIPNLSHLMGALFGYLYYRYAHRLDYVFLKLEVKGRQREAGQGVRERDRLQADVDRLLDKVNAGGLDSLSAEEQARLRQASERLKELEP